MPSIHVYANFLLSEHDNEALKRIIEQKNISKTEAYRRAISLYLVACEASDKNLGLSLCNEAGVVKTKIIGY